MIDKATVQKIKDVADIVDVVSDYVRLVRRGANYMGLCPFHNERTPSFSVNKSKNFCYCFSCHKGGSPVNFIMEKEGISYHDALLQLAKRYGIKVEERELTDEERIAQNEREAMLVANEWAMHQMESNLRYTEEGRDIGLQYFYQRGVTEEAIRQFHLGYSLDKGNELIAAAKRDGIDVNILKQLGLVGTSQQGRDYDRFHGRVIFPIMNTSGKVIAFGGRDLKGGIAKYINSPESTLYKKSNELYGMAQARQAIVKEDRCFLVEGYMDVIGMWQSGMQNVVASSGTALTDGQISLIRRFTKKVTLIYDGDAAGIKASLRGIDMLLSQDLDVKVLLLPDGHDPDSFAKSNTPEEFRKYVSEHETDIIHFKASVLSDQGFSDPQRRIDAVNSMVESLACINDTIKLDVYIQECSALLGVSNAAIATAVAKEKKTRQYKQRRENELRQNMGNAGSGSDNAGQGLTQVGSGTVGSEQPAASADVNQVSGEKVATVSGRLVAQGKSPYYDQERKLMELCVKYGFLSFTVSDVDDNEFSINVVDYFHSEMETDSLEFSVDTFRELFDIILNLRDDFRVSLDAKTLDVEQEIENRRRMGIEKIASSNMTMAMIEREEKELEKSLAQYKEEELLEFTKSYLPRELASHENDKIRMAVIDLIKEKHQLSQIYSRDNNVPERDEDRLNILCERALIELRYEILTRNLKDLFASLAKASEEDDRELVHKLQMEISMMMQWRSDMAKSIGDRVISPR